MKYKDRYEEIKEKFKETEEVLHRFETALDHLADGIYITDKDTVAVYVNRAYEKISGAAREKFLGKSIYDVVEEKLIDSSGTLKAIEENKAISMNQVLNNGRVAFITSTPVFSKDNQVEYIVTIVRDITEIINLRNEISNKEFEINLLKNKKYNNIIYKSVKTEQMLEKLLKVSKYDTTVFLTGETGVGKSLIAKYIHDHSSRKDERFVQLNCASIPSTLIESELFGYEKGSFTGASKSGKIGILEQAHKGTIFLDEIGELPLDMQPKLLTAIQDKKIRRIGSSKEVDIDVRIITATNADIEKMVRDNLFREDLYYRLKVVPVEIPPLRERREDILELARFFIKKLEKKYSRNIEIEKEVLKIFYEYSWPGNVRELENLIERLFVMCDLSKITVEDLPSNMLRSEEKSEISGIIPIKEANAIVESRLIKNAFSEAQNVKDAAKMLGISDSTFVRKRQRYIKKGYLKM